MDIQEVPQSDVLDNAYLDLATVLLDKGLSNDAVYDIIIKVAAEVELRVLGELMSILPEEKHVEAKNLSAQGVTGEEIMKALGLTDEQIDDIEHKKFAEVINALVPALNNS